jgi:hypothetical protein
MTGNLAVAAAEVVLRIFTSGGLEADARRLSQADLRGPAFG